MLKALVVGNGKSGKSARKLLKKMGYRVTLIEDDRSEKYFKLRDRLFDGLSLVALSPGVSLSSEIVQIAKQKNIKVLGEFELGANQIFGDIIAVTGTNGKTTVTTLISEIIKSEYSNTFVGGNIGIAVSSFALKTTSKSKSVLEVSSFQLETTDKFKPHIAIILNITEDHLNWHKTMENYTKAKLKIFKNQDEKDFLLLNKDDKFLMSQDFSTVRAQKYFFSLKEKCKGCYVQGGNIYFYDGKTQTFIMHTKDICLIGEHNIENALAAILSGILSGIAPKKVADITHNFKGVEHRLEYVAKINNVTFINDSKGTNINSTIAAMNAIKEPVTLILGGSDKGYEFDELFIKMPKNIKRIIVMGETKDKILLASKKLKKCLNYKVDTMKDAVYLAYELTRIKGGVVLLSPACASFDMFSNFEERGRIFCRYVKSLIIRGKYESFWTKNKTEKEIKY